jgi:hypothetical protein
MTFVASGQFSLGICPEPAMGSSLRDFGVFKNQIETPAENILLN